MEGNRQPWKNEPEGILKLSDMSIKWWETESVVPRIENRRYENLARGSD